MTIIGPGVHIQGDVSFTGFLRLQGNVEGNISCDNDARGTAVVHGAGSVTGTIVSPHIIVGGHVTGPLTASGSIEIHEGACVVGDATYRQLAIEAGATIDGALRPTAPEQVSSQQLDRRVISSEPPLTKALAVPFEHDRRSTDRFRRPRRVGGFLVLAVVVGGLLWFARDRFSSDRRDALPAVLAPEQAPPPVTAIVEEPAPKAAAAEEPKAAAIHETPVEVMATAPTVAPPAPAPAPEKPKAAMRVANAGLVVNVQGSDFDKPGSFFYVEAREPVVLFKKQRDDAGDGQRIELPDGARRRITINAGDLVRVAQGRNVDVFYQGRKVRQGNIDAGAWLSFVPFGTGTAGQGSEAQ